MNYSSVNFGVKKGVDYNISDENDELYYATLPDENGIIDYEDFSNLVSIGNILSSNIPSPSKEIDEDIYDANPTFLYNYYSNLKDNIMTNKMGICGYTAIGMFLSYFDTYWDDHFIPETYDSEIDPVTSTEFNAGKHYKSPGIKDDTLANTPSINALKTNILNDGIIEDSVEYKEALDRAIMDEILAQVEENSFAGKLFSIAIANKSISPHFSLDSYGLNEDGSFVGNTVMNPNDYVEGIGVSYDIVNNVLRDYIAQNNYISDAIQIETSKMNKNLNFETEKSRIRNEIIELVQSGKPVLMGEGGFDDKNNNGVKDTYPELPDGTEDKRNERSYGHDVVAYYYNEDDDTLYGNMGWKSGGPCDLDSFFNKAITDYWSIDISSSLPQTYTDNYYFSDENRYYCPYDNGRLASVSTLDYGFADAYPTDTSTKDDFVTHTLTNDFSFKTRRYRTGYIHNEYIVMSCIRTGIREAFIEYEFDEPVYGIVVDLAHWRELSCEHLDKSSGHAGLKIWGQQDPMNPYDTGGWLNIFDLLSDSTDLTRDRTNPTSYTIEFDQPVRNFKFYSNIYNPEVCNSNKGRICIGDMKIITERDYAYL